DQLLEPSTLYAALASALGPLADAQTHGFRTVDRAPWRPRRAAALFEAALRGPLSWLGLVAWASERPTTNDQRPTTDAADKETRRHGDTETRMSIFSVQR